MTAHGHVHPERLGENYDGDYECADCGEQCGGTFQCGCCGRIVGWCQGGDTLGPHDDVCADCLAKFNLPDSFDWQAGDRFTSFGWSQPMEPSGLRWKPQSINGGVYWFLRDTRLVVWDDDDQVIGFVHPFVYHYEARLSLLRGSREVKQGTIKDCAQSLIALAKNSGGES